MRPGLDPERQERREHRQIEQRRPEPRRAREVLRLDEGPGERRERARGGELHQHQRQDGVLGRGPAEGDDLAGEHHRAGERKRIAQRGRLRGVGPRGRESGHPGEGKEHSDQGRRRRALSEEAELDQRHHDDERAGEKAAPRRRGPLQPLRLQQKADAEQPAREHAVAKQLAADGTQSGTAARSERHEPAEQRGGERHPDRDEQERRRLRGAEQRSEDGEAAPPHRHDQREREVSQRRRTPGRERRRPRAGTLLPASASRRRARSGRGRSPRFPTTPPRIG